MTGRHHLLNDRIAIRARMDGVAFPTMTTDVLCDAYVEEIATAYAEYTPDADADVAVANAHAIARELRRRDRIQAQRFIDEVHALLLDECPELDLSQLTCH